MNDSQRTTLELILSGITEVEKSRLPISKFFTEEVPMMHQKLLVLVAAAFVSDLSSAQELSVSAAQVSRVQVYETTDDSTSVWLWLNGNGRVGPNPTNSSISCELWTNSKSVHASALAAMLSGKKVDVSYVDNSNGSYWCKVKALAVVNE